MSHVVLGLDIGPNSIGWSLIDSEAQRIIDLGVRIFPEGVDNFDTSKEKSRNEDRRIARGMRRQIARRARRKRKLREALVAVGLFPADPVEQHKLLEKNPYQLRSRALNERLEPHEIGRVLIHLSQRRGFKSNKKEEAKAEAKAKRKQKTDDSKKAKPAAEKSTEDMLLEMDDLERAITESGAQTLGRFLYQKYQDFKHSSRKPKDHIRGRHTKRKMLVDEFDAVWAEQSKHYPEILTQELAFGRLGRDKDISRPISKQSKRRRNLKDVASFDLQTLSDQDCFDRKLRPDLNAFGLFGLIFFHRTLKPVPKEIVGICELESREGQKERLKRKLGIERDKDLPRIDIRRCPRADRHAQRFRILQEVNNIRLLNGTNERPLKPEERALVLDRLSKSNEWTFESMKNEIGKLPDSPPAEAIRINLEKGKRTKLQGMQTDCELAKALGKGWHQRPEPEKDGIVRALIHSVDDEETHAKLTTEFGLLPDDADKALAVDLTGKGYVNFCLHAIDELIPFLEQGMRLMGKDKTDSAIHAAGYMRRDELQRRLFDKLPDPARMSLADCPIGDIPNPVVKRALVELRKVVNAIIRQHGKPDEVHVEMGRDVKTRPKNKRSLAYRRYREEEAVRAERTKLRDAAKAKLREHGIGYGAGGRNILKYLLWQEQGKLCIYSGKSICFSKLMSDETQIDHILPTPGIDDSPMNLVVCYQSENHPATGKGQQTPRKWLEDAEPEKYQKVLQRAKKLPYPKQRRFLQKEVDTAGWVARQLNDTRYIAKATVEYLRLLTENDHDVIGLKGQLTSTLRRLWGLDTVLSELPHSPAWSEQANLRPGEKNRADHRHHAIDAVVVALTDRARLLKLSQGFTVEEFTDEESGERELKTVYRGEHIGVAWDGLRNAVVESIQRIDGRDHGEKDRRGVSHRPKRKLGFALHKDQPFGRIADPEGNDDARWVKRKPIADLSASEVLAIRDHGIRKIVLKHLEEKRELGIAKRQGTQGRPKIVFENLRTRKESDAKGAFDGVCMPSGVPIKKVRLRIKTQTIRPIREIEAERSGDDTRIAFVEPDELHHACLFQWNVGNKTYRDAVFVTQLAAMKRLSTQQQNLSERINQWKSEGVSSREIERRKRLAMREIANEHPLIQRNPSKLGEDDAARIPPDAEFLFSVSTGDMLLVEMDGRDRLMVVNTMVSTQPRIHLVDATDASRKKKDVGLTPNSLVGKYNARKVTVDPLGRIRWAND